MSNNWKFSDLTQRERLGRIRNGDTEVYEAEKANNKSLMQQYEAQGIDTSNISAWDTAIDVARAKATAVPKIRVTYGSDAVTELLNQLTKQYKKDKATALENAVKARASLEEWLVNNGLGADTEFAKNKRKSLEDELSTMLSTLDYDYNTAFSKAKK